MSRPVTARTAAARKQILAILRTEWPLPIPTGAVLLGMAKAHNCNRPPRTDGWPVPGASPIERRAWCWYGPAYAQLRALARLGLVEQVRRPHMRSAYWRYVPDDQSDAHFNAVLAELEDA